MSRPTTTDSGGISFLGALGLIFITLELTGSIHWSWWWVLAPLWIPVALVLLILAIAGVRILISRLRHRDG